MARTPIRTPATAPTTPAPAAADAAEPGEGRRPVHRIRLGYCQAALWENESEYGVRYTVTLERLYTDAEGAWQYTRTFGAHDLPALAALLQLVIADLHHRRAEPWDGE